MRLAPALALVTAMALADASAQTPRDLTGYLPAETPLVVDLHDGAATVKAALDLVEPLPKGLPVAARAFLLSLPLLTKAVTGMDLVDLLEVVAPGPLAFAVFPAGAGKPFPVLLSRVTETGEVGRVLRRVRAKTKIHADVSAGVLTVTDTRAHLRQVLRFRKSGRPTLLAGPGFLKKRATMPSGRSIRFHLNVTAVRGKYAKTKSYWDQLDEGARFLVGPLVRTLDLAGRLDGRLDITKTGFTVTGSADADLAQDPKGVGRLTAEGGKARRIPAAPDATLACLSLDRNVGELLEHPDRWLGDDGALGVKSFLSIADQVLGGASLLKDLLPNVRMPMSLFVTESKPDEDADQPRVQLPAFTLVAKLGEDVAEAKKLLRRAMMTVTTIANVQRVQDKKTPIAVRKGRRGEYRFDRVRFADWNGPGDPPTEQGLSPTLLFAHGHGILASTIDGAVRMAESLKTGASKEVQGDYIVLRGGPIAKVLKDNLTVLSINRVLEEGGTRKEADMFWSAAESVLRLLRFEGHVAQRTGATRFEFGLTRTKELK